LRTFATDWIVQQFHTSNEFRSILLPKIRDQLRRGAMDLNADRDRLAGELKALEIRERNLRKSIAISEELSAQQLESLVGDLAFVTAQLITKRQQVVACQAPLAPYCEMDDDQIAQSLPDVLQHLLATSFEMAEVFRGFFPTCVIMPVQAIDTGQVRPRANLSVRSVGAAKSAENLEGLECLSVDLFQHPVHFEHMAEAVRLRSQTPRPTLRQIGELLGTSYMTVKRALALDKQMESLPQLFAMVFINVATGRVWISPATRHPTEVWVEEQARAFIEHAKAEDLKVDLVTRDNNQIYKKGFDQVMTEAGIRPSRLALRAPNTNAYVERFIQSVQVECLNHFLVFGEKHFDYLMREYVEHYHTERPHQGLGNVLLNAEPPPDAVASDVRCNARLGGLLKSYYGVVA
jgi:hypothetical protein